jgi:AcrR family transcriptional regulator
VALEIINETGDFDLPMRDLAARARVSLRTPYALFGSKSGVITELLHRDQARWRSEIRALQTADPVDDLFANLERSAGFFRQHQPFYRALFRATQSYSGGVETEPARENVRPLRVACQRLMAAGMLIEGMSPEILAESLTDIWVGTMREWAASTFDIELTFLRTAFGYATMMAGGMRPAAATRLRERALCYHALIERFHAEHGEVPQRDLDPATQP